MRTYSGHSSARASNELYRTNLGQGPDRPLGRLRPPDPDRLRPRPRRSPAARSARSACPSRTSARCATLFDGIPLDEMNTSMTINATAMWLLAMYVALGRGAGRRPARARRHDAERHRQGVPVAGHVHLRARGVAAAHRRPDLPHGAARPAAGTRSTCARTTSRRRARRRCRRSRTGSPPRSACSTRCASRGRSPRTSSPRSSGRISFFVDAGIRFVEEMCKMRAFTAAVGPHLRRALRRRRTRSCAGSATACR